MLALNNSQWQLYPRFTMAKLRRIDAGIDPSMTHRTAIYSPQKAMHNHIFLSYCNTDSERALQIAESLSAAGFNIWTGEKIPSGDQWAYEVQHYLDTCVAFVVIMTSSAFTSRWVQNEVNRALRKSKPIFPILLEGDVWLALESTQSLDMREAEQLPSQFYVRLAQTIHR